MLPSQSGATDSIQPSPSVNSGNRKPIGLRRCSPLPCKSVERDGAKHHKPPYKTLDAFPVSDFTHARLRQESRPPSLAANRTSRLQVTACPRSPPNRSSITAVSLGAFRRGPLPGREMRRRIPRQTNHCRGKPERRQKCAVILNIFVTVRPSGARSATEDLVSYGTIPGELRSVQKGVLIGSGRVRKPTANGYPGFAPPDRACIVHCFALGGAA